MYRDDVGITRDGIVFDSDDIMDGFNPYKDDELEYMW